LNAQAQAHGAADAAANPRGLLIRVRLERDLGVENPLEELALLAVSAGIDVVEQMLANRKRPDPALYIGSGKAEEIRQLIADRTIDVVIFDHPISSVQQRNLTHLLALPVIDRTELILDIFARRARSYEGRLQVELAQIEHQMSRLVRSWSHLERQRGGIGVRGGPGEKQVELDRRMLDVKAKQLRLRLEKSAKQRKTRRRSRERHGAFKVSLVGYTNAGKSSLFNRLTGANSLAADQLFATLDTLTRRLRLPDGSELVLSDTVGFVRDLPHTLIDAFKATLEETADADLLIHVVDASSHDRDDQQHQVDEVLGEIGAGEVPRLTVFNKIDRIDRPASFERGPCDNIERLWLSAKTGVGVADLVRAMSDRKSVQTPSQMSWLSNAEPIAVNIFSE
jgi:GTPase